MGDQPSYWHVSHTIPGNDSVLGVQLHRRYGPRPSRALSARPGRIDEAAPSSNAQMPLHRQADRADAPSSSHTVLPPATAVAAGGADSAGRLVAGEAEPSEQGSASVSGQSPPSCRSSPSAAGSQHGRRFVRLYPDAGADPSVTWEPGTPSNETATATQQIWDALSRGQHTAFRVRLPPLDRRAIYVMSVCLN